MVIFNDLDRNLFVTIDDDVIDILKTSSLAAFPNETGGFLVGRYMSNNHAYIERLATPRKKKCRPYSYERSTKGMNKFWDELYKQGLIYLGEWHSHPMGNCNYSWEDCETIKSIASSPEVNIDLPLLLIVSLNKVDVKDLGVYYYNDNQLIKMNRT